MFNEDIDTLTWFDCLPIEEMSNVVNHFNIKGYVLNDKQFNSYQEAMSWISEQEPREGSYEYIECEELPF